MQPYLWPYLGYFQLLALSDVFIVYDDVNFIKKGWINRNRVLGAQGPLLFSVPLQSVSQNKTIKDTALHQTYDKWRVKFLTTLRHCYGGTPHFGKVFPLIEQVMESCYPGDSISKLCLRSLQCIKQYLNLTTQLRLSSVSFTNQDLKAQNRILDICKQEQATRYVNLIGGRELYTSKNFEQHSIELLFHKIKEHQYKQFDVWQPYLSIIDVLMFCDQEETRKLLQQYELIR